MVVASPEKKEACEPSVDMPSTETKILCHCEGLLTTVKFTYNSAIIMQSFCIVSRSLQYRLKSCFVLGITLLCGPLAVIGVHGNSNKRFAVPSQQVTLIHIPPPWNITFGDFPRSELGNIFSQMT